MMRKLLFFSISITFVQTMQAMEALTIDVDRMHLDDRARELFLEGKQKEDEGNTQGAILCYCESARLGNITALDILGDIYQLQSEDEPNVAKKVELLELAAACYFARAHQGDAEALVNLGLVRRAQSRIAQTDESVKEFESRAFQNFKKAALKNDKNGQNYVADMLYEAAEQAIDAATKEMYLNAALNFYVLLAQDPAYHLVKYDVGNIYSLKALLRPCEEEIYVQLAINWYELCGNSHALYAIGCMREKQTQRTTDEGLRQLHFQEACNYYKKAAQAGHEDARQLLLEWQIE